MWAWVAPGSGLSVNIGRAFIVERGRKGEGLHKFLTKVNRDLPQGRERLARYLRDVRNVSDDDPMEFDSIVFPGRSHKSWHGEAFDEVVMLRWGKEMAFVGGYLEHFRCGGPHPTTSGRANQRILRFGYMARRVLCLVPPRSLR